LIYPTLPRYISLSIRHEGMLIERTSDYMVTSQPVLVNIFFRPDDGSE
jgi:hypothetical protein